MEGVGARFIVIINDIEDAEDQAQEPIRRFYQQEPSFELSETKFIKLFRLSKELARNLIQMVTPFMEAPTRASALSIQTKVGKWCLVPKLYFSMYNNFIRCLWL